MSLPLKKKFHLLCDRLRELDNDGLLICFSGGLDSSFLAAAAVEADCHPTLLSFFIPTISRRDITAAMAMGRELQLPHQISELNTLSIPQIANNAINRCYHCKKAIYTQAINIAASAGLAHIVDGCNIDDLSPDIYRPGLQAAEELNILHPLAEAELTKSEIRQLSRELGLSNHARPASPCLASRFPYDTPLNISLLEQVANGEDILREMGLTDFRLRVHGNVARLEVTAEQEALVLEKRRELTEKLEKLGYEYICLDLTGLNSGGWDKKILKRDQK